MHARRGSGDYMTSRLDTLLDKFGFQNRWHHLMGPEEYLQCDYAQTDTILAKEQQKALQYIQEVLNLEK